MREVYVQAAPAAEPITVSELKTHLRIDHTTEDTYLGTLITAVRERVERWTGRALITQTLEVTRDDWWYSSAYLALPRPPLQSVTSITYYDTDNTAATFANENYLVDTRSTPGRIKLLSTSSFPSTELKEMGGVVIRYVAGYGLAVAVPQEIKWAIFLWAGELYENRENTAPPGGLSPIPSAAERLLLKYKVY